VLRSEDVAALVSLDAVEEEVGDVNEVAELDETELDVDGLGIGLSGPPGFQPIGELTGVPESLQNFCHPDVISAMIVC
jgi:hypothetical protein